MSVLKALTAAILSTFLFLHNKKKKIKKATTFFIIQQIDLLMVAEFQPGPS
jgi:hypothetical protein